MSRLKIIALDVGKFNGGERERKERKVFNG